MKEDFRITLLIINLGRNEKRSQERKKENSEKNEEDKMIIFWNKKAIQRNKEKTGVRKTKKIQDDQSVEGKKRPKE